jgi:hypothetical protein
VRLAVQPGEPTVPDDADVSITASLSDVRCAGSGPACGPANAAAGDDYTGELVATADVRLTDKFNGSSPDVGTEPGTVVDFPFPVTVPCSASPGAGTGGSCSVSTSANAVVPGAVTEGRRAIVQVGQVRVFDGGPDGDAATADNDLFAVQGLFVP